METRGLVTAAIALGVAVLASAPLSAAHARSTYQLKLVKASGVPHLPDHGYRFEGIINWDWAATKAEFWTEGKGRWKESSHEASESLSFQGEVVGQLVSKFKCQADPWLNHATNCVVVDVQYVHTQGKQFNWPAEVKRWGKPISTPSVTLAAATELSKQSSAGAPPPPPPPAGSKPGPKPVFGQMIPVKPDLLVTGALALVESSCDPALPAVRVQVTVKNAGATPFPALPGKQVIFVKAGKGLVSHGIEMPALNSGAVYPPPGRSRPEGVPIKANVPLSQLAGTSQTLEIQLNVLKWAEESNHANNAKTVRVSFPASYCRQRTASKLPAAGTLKPVQSRSLNPQPEPPSQPRRVPAR